MNSELLTQAQEALLIRDVYLIETKAYLEKGFDPKYAVDQNQHDKLITQFKRGVKKREIIELTGEHPEEAYKLLRVYMDVGMRLVEEESKESSKITGQIKANIEATFVAEYLMQRADLNENAMDEFALYNSPYHIQPYWREYLMSTCMRMNLPKVVVPMFRVQARSRSSSEKMPRSRKPSNSSSAVLSKQ